MDVHISPEVVAMEHIALEDAKETENSVRIMSRITEVEGDEFMFCLEEFLNNDFSHTIKFKIVSSIPTKQQYIEEVYDGFDQFIEIIYFLKETKNGGFLGDDFVGHTYVLLPSSGKYLYFEYSCG